MVKGSVNRYVSRRIDAIRKDIVNDIQRLHEKTLKNLEEIFMMASRVAGGEIKRRRINGKGLV